MEIMPKITDRFVCRLRFGDTKTNLSLKLLKAVDEVSQPIFLPFRSYNQSFGQVLKRYLITAQPVHPINTQYAIQFLKTKELVSENKPLELYKEEIEDESEIYFRIYPADIHHLIQINENLRSLKSQSQIENPSATIPANNIKIIVRKPNGQETTITINKYNKMKVLKLQICKRENLEENQFSLVYAGRRMDNEQTTLVDYDIQDDSLIMLVMIVKVGCFSPHSLITLADKTTVKVQHIKEGDQVLSYNEERGQMESDEVISVHRTHLSSYLQIILENGGSIKCTSNHKFHTKQGWKSFCFEQNKQRLKVGDSITDIDYSSTKITSITNIDSQYPIEFFHISTSRNHTFFLNNYLSHNMQVKFLNTADGSILTLNITESDTIQMVRLRLSEMLTISQHQILIVLNKRQLNDNESISDYIQDIKNCNYVEVIQHERHIIVVNRLKTKREYRFNLDENQNVRQLKNQIEGVTDISRDNQILILNNVEMLNSQKIGEFNLNKNFNRINLIQLEEQQISVSRMASNMKKILYVRIDENDYLRLNYYSLREMKVQQFIASFIPNSKKCFSLLFGEIILSPADYLKRIEDHAIFNNEEINCYVVKCYDRLAFYQTLDMGQKFNLPAVGLDQNVIDAFKSKDAQIKQKIQKMDYIYTLKAKFNEQLQEFYRPIQVYTHFKASLTLEGYLQKFFLTDAGDISSLAGHNFCSSLVKSLESIPVYIGQTHRILQNIRFQDIYQKRGDTLYFQSFLSTHSKVESLQLANQRNYTLLHIKSLTGRPIGLISDSVDEIVFRPFSYFFISKVTQEANLDEVWLTEVPTPISFQKDVFMWVDDEPNSKENREICNLIDFSRFQLVQLVSTEIAEYWMKEFNWILKWGGKGIKVMSDMNRAEGQNNAMVHQAGINLVQSFHNNFGYTAPIFIFCKKSSAGRKAMQQRKIKPGRIQKITNDEFELIKYLTSQ